MNSIGNDGTCDHSCFGETSRGFFWGLSRIFVTWLPLPEFFGDDNSIVECGCQSCKLLNSVCSLQNRKRWLKCELTTEFSCVSGLCNALEECKICLNNMFFFSYSTRWKTHSRAWAEQVGGSEQINQCKYWRPLVPMDPPSANPNITCCV